jgi:phosphomannomutase
LVYHLAAKADEDDESTARIVVRPSGTEPKIKCYYELCEPMAEGESLADAETRAQAKLDALIAQHQQDLEA